MFRIGPPGRMLDDRKKLVATNAGPAKCSQDRASAITAHRPVEQLGPFGGGRASKMRASFGIDSVDIDGAPGKVANLGCCADRRGRSPQRNYSMLVV